MGLRRFWGGEGGLSGAGDDFIGPFTFEGRVSPEAISLTKVYPEEGYSVESAGERLQRERVADCRASFSSQPRAEFG